MQTPILIFQILHCKSSETNKFFIRNDFIKAFRFFDGKINKERKTTNLIHTLCLDLYITKNFKNFEEK